MLSCEICEIFKSTYFEERLQTAASGNQDYFCSKLPSAEKIILCTCSFRLSWKKDNPAKAFSYEFCNIFKNTFLILLQLYYDETARQSIFCEFCKIFKNIFLREHLWAIVSREFWLKVSNS